MGQVNRFLVVGSLIVVLALPLACASSTRKPVSPASEASAVEQQKQLQVQLEEALHQLQAIRIQSAFHPEDQRQAELKEMLQRIKALEQQIKAKQEQENIDKAAKAKQDETNMNWALQLLLGMLGI